MLRTLIAPFTLLACSSLSGVSTQVAGTPSAGVVHHTPPQDAVTIAPEETTLWDLVIGLEVDTGTRFLVDQALRQNLENTSISLTSALEVQATARWSVAESLLVEAGYKLAVLRQSGPRILSLKTSAGGRGAGAAAKYLFVPEERIDEFAEYSATLITTAVTLPHSDVRNLSNSLRALMTDTSTMNIVPAGNSNSLIVRGTGAVVVDTVRMLRAIDEASSRTRTAAMPGTTTVPTSEEN
ncbi:MAG: hypothetical protein AAFZ65_15580 [Planctomycetota bacterium]